MNLHNRSIIVLLMILYSMMSYFDRTIISVAGPDIMRTFQLSETQMGSVYSAFVLGYAFAMIPGGFLVDRFGPVWTLTAVGIGSALFTALTAYGIRPALAAWLGILPALIVVRILLGITTAPLYPSCARMIGDQFSPIRRALIWGFVAAGAGLGSAFSPVIFSWSLSRYDWRGSFGLAASATAMLAIAWWLCVRDLPRSMEKEVSPSAAVSLAGLYELLKNRNVLLLSIGYFTVSYFEYIFFYWIYYYFKEVRNLPQSQVTLYTTVIFLSWVVMTPIGGLVSDQLVCKIGSRGRAMVAVPAMITSVMLFIIGTRTTEAYLTGFLYALSFGLMSSSDGPFWSSTVQVGRDKAGAACGILNTGSNVGGFIAPVLTPAIASICGWTTALYFACGVAFVGAGAWFLVNLDEK